MTETPVVIEESGFQTRFVTAADGLKLFGRDYGPRHAATTPVVCLAGLTRNSADFHELAIFLSQEATPARRVIALDYRGRGESDFDPDWKNYDPRVEAQDVIAFLTAIGVHEAIFVGTSRGGLVAYALAAIRPTLIRAAVLNDIGAVIEGKGLVRIRGYVGKLPEPKSYADGADILRRTSDAQFPALSQTDWVRGARRIWREKNGRLVPRYDVRLMNGMASIDLEKPLPPLWPLFDSLRDVPVFVIRGANSDLLSAETVSAMTARHRDCEAITVLDQGHAPLLADEPTLAAIKRFMERVDAGNPSRQGVARKSGG